jgi:hypothetical protein
MVAALYVATGGCYFGLPDVDPWDVHRDARKYDGPYPVVAHPPCFLWVNLAAVNWKRYRRDLPAWYPGGNDGGCFAAALAAVRKFGGVLEHPADTHAFAAFGLARPTLGWQRTMNRDEYVCEVWQSAYGHRARKRTWLLYVGAPPHELRWTAKPGTAQVGWFDRNKPTLGKREAIATPIEFRDELIALAENARCAKEAA